MEIAPKYIVTIGGVSFENSAKHNKPIKLEIEHRDHEASRLMLTVHDSATDPAGPFPLFNSTPDPHVTPGVPVKCVAGWDDGSTTTVFQGELVAKKNSYPAASKTVFVALHDSHKLRRFAKHDTLPNHAVLDMLEKKAAENGCTIKVDPSAAGDPALTTAMEVIYQVEQSNWQLMLHYLVGFGFISCCGDPNASANTIVIKKDKTNDPQYKFEFGGTEYVSHDIRSEQKRPSRSDQRHAHTHDPPESGHVTRTDGEAKDQSQNTAKSAPAHGRMTDTRRGLFAAASTKNLARQLERQGREIQITLRFQPQLHNEEQIVLHGFGPQIDGTWETAEVVHSLAGKSETRLVCWQK